jgi:hypothetical protein
MFESKPLRCHSRENGNPEPKNQYSWIPASAGMTDLRNINLIFRNFKTCRKCQKNSPFYTKNKVNLDSNDII